MHAARACIISTLTFGQIGAERVATLIDSCLKKYHYSINEDFMPYALQNLRDQVPRVLKVRPPSPPSAPPPPLRPRFRAEQDVLFADFSLAYFFVFSFFRFLFSLSFLFAPERLLREGGYCSVYPVLCCVCPEPEAMLCGGGVGGVRRTRPRLTRFFDFRRRAAQRVARFACAWRAKHAPSAVRPCGSFVGVAAYEVHGGRLRPVAERLVACITGCFLLYRVMYLVEEYR